MTIRLSVFFLLFVVGSSRDLFDLLCFEFFLDSLDFPEMFKKMCKASSTNTRSVTIAEEDSLLVFQTVSTVLRDMVVTLTLK